MPFFDKDAAAVMGPMRVADPASMQSLSPPYNAGITDVQDF